MITTAKDTSLQTKISQLETSTMILNNLDVCRCDSIKLVKEAFLQINTLEEFRENITGSKNSIEKTWNQKYKCKNDLGWRYDRNKRLKEF